MLQIRIWLNLNVELTCYSYELTLSEIAFKYRKSEVKEYSVSFTTRRDMSVRAFEFLKLNSFILLDQSAEKDRALEVGVAHDLCDRPRQRLLNKASLYSIV